MSNVQLYLAVGVPVIANGLMLLMLRDGVNQRLDAINQRFDDMRDLWRAELRRVEDVLDARLKHVEQ